MVQLNEKSAQSGTFMARTNHALNIWEFFLLPASSGPSLCGRYLLSLSPDPQSEAQLGGLRPGRTNTLVGDKELK